MSDRGPSKPCLVALLSVMTFFWAANFIVTKFALREIPPLLTTGLRMVISAATMLPIYRWYAVRGRIRWTRADLLKLTAIGVLGVGLNQVFFVSGMARTSVAHAAIIIGLTPVTVLLLASASGQERLKAARLAGMFLAMLGVAVVQISSASSKSASFLGDLLIFLGSSTFAVYTVTGKAEARRLGSVTVNTFAYVASAIALLPVTVWSGAGFNWAGVSWVGWTSLFYMAVIASVLCYIIYYYALSHMAASRVSTVSYIQPLLATLLAIPMLGEFPTASLMAGGALVFAGVFVAERF